MSKSTASAPSDQQYPDSDSDPVDSDPDYNSYPDFDSDSDDKEDLTEEDLKIYGAVVGASGGFKAPYLHNVATCHLICPLRLDNNSLTYLKPFSVAALNHYNQDKNTDYEFVRVLRATHQGVRGIMYYLTFEEGPLKIKKKIFEAQVLLGLPKYKGDDTPEVMFCRVKRNPTKAGMEHL